MLRVIPTTKFNRTTAMTDQTGNTLIECLAEDNCRVGQLTDGIFENVVHDRHHCSCCREQAKYAEMVVLNDLIFGSPNHTIQELVEKRALHKLRTMQRRSTLS